MFYTVIKRMKTFKPILRSLLFFFLFSVASFCCNKIETDDTLNKKDKAFIRSLRLLDKDEKIYKFYSEYKKRVAGNFFTDERMASYWIDEKDEDKNKIEFAYYSDIVSIDTVYYAGLTYCPYMMVKKTDSTQFKVCVEGKREDIKAFFEDALRLWKQKRLVR